MGINGLIKKLLGSIQNWKDNKNCKVLLDEEITKRYENSCMYYFYRKSVKGLNEYIGMHNHKMPTVNEWNKMAKENGYLSAESMKYMMQLEFPQ